MVNKLNFNIHTQTAIALYIHTYSYKIQILNIQTDTYQLSDHERIS